jgi:hypothetical protein
MPRPQIRVHYHGYFNGPTERSIECKKHTVEDAENFVLDELAKGYRRGRFTITDANNAPVGLSAINTTRRN